MCLCSPKSPPFPQTTVQQEAKGTLVHYDDRKFIYRRIFAQLGGSTTLTIAGGEV